MDCPVCKAAMVALELHEIEIDHCIACGGIWLDAGELEMLLGDAEKKDVLLASLKPVQATREADRKCPLCLKKMAKIEYGTDKPVLVDKCRNNDGIWFDRGELQEVIAMGSSTKQNQVLTLLKDMFGEDSTKETK